MTDAATPPWNEHRVVVFAGQFDTNIKTGVDYQTRALADLFAIQPSSRAKGAGLAFIPSSYSDYDARDHDVQRNRGVFVTLAADIDKGNHPLERLEPLVRVFVGGAAWLIYTSAHARPDDMRWRVIIPLRRATTFPLWGDAPRMTCHHLSLARVTKKQ